MPSSASRVRLEPKEEQLAAAITSGAPPFERLRHAAFRVPASDPTGAAAARRWVDAICAGSARLESELLTASCHDYASVVRAFGPAQLDVDEPLPPWAECLVQMVRALPEVAPGSLADEDPTTAATRVLFDSASQLLDWEALHARYPLDARVLASLTRQLATRILLACGSTLELENATQAKPTWDFSRAAWMERLCGFTSLNFVVGTAICQWKQNALEILTRAVEDLPVLQQTLLKDTSPGPLVGIEGDLGDRHNDGRSVAMLTFASGGRVVYKPKDSRCAYQFLDLLAYLNAAAPSVALPTRQIICRGCYAWEEYVEEREVRTEGEAASFFRRFGMLLRVLQLVDGRDFWIDNLRISGDLPVFIDLECILHPRLKTAGFQGSLLGLEPELYEESVLPTAAVTHPIDIPGAGRQDFGALSATGVRLLPLGAWTGYRDRRNGNLWLAGGQIYWKPQLAWPQSRGRPADVVEYLDDLEGGYREAQTLLCRCAPGLLSTASPLTGIGEVPVRVLMRSTWEYLVLLRASLEPMALLDGNARELALANVLATTPAWGSDPDAKWRLTIAHSELDALRTLDIPEFYSLPSNASVMDSSFGVVSDVFDGSAYSRMTRRLAEVDSFDLETHVRILRGAVDSIARVGVEGPAT